MRSLQKVRIITNGVFYEDYFLQDAEPLKSGDKIQYNFWLEADEKEMHIVSKDQNGEWQIIINSPVICTSREDLEAKIQEGIDSIEGGEFYTSEELKDFFENLKDKYKEDSK